MLPALPHPIASAALPWEMVLAIIVFNIIAGILTKRKQKPGAKPGRKPGAADADAETRRQAEAQAEALRRQQEARARAQAEADRKEAEAEARRSRDQARAGAEERVPAEAAGSQAQDRRAKAKETGKDLLGQLARELGLELPESPKPAPAPRPAPSRASAAAKPQRESLADVRKRRLAEAREDGEHDGSLADRIAAQRAAGPEASRRANDAQPVPIVSPLPEPARAASSGLAGDLSDPEALRRAFILKTVLDKPLALQPRG